MALENTCYYKKRQKLDFNTVMETFYEWYKYFECFMYKFIESAG